jgi:hypothetical protein
MKIGKLFVWCLVVTLGLGLFLTTTPLSAAEKSVGKAFVLVDGTAVASFKNEKSDEKKLVILEGLLSSGSDQSLETFFSLLTTSERQDLGVFKDAMEAKGDLKSILYMGQYVQNSIRSFLKTYEELRPEATRSEIKSAVKSYQDSLGKKIEVLAPELKLIAGKNCRSLVNTINTCYSKIKDDSSPEEINSSGINEATICLLLLEEKGFEALLDSITSKDQQIMLMIMMEYFGANAVIPILKAYEDPKSSKLKRDISGALIYSFSKTDPLVLDKVVEAFKHGRYFEVKSAAKLNEKGEKVLNVEALMGAVSSWWGVHVEGHYKGEKTVARYIGENYIKGSSLNEGVIRLICQIDFQTGLEYLSDIDPADVPAKILDALFAVSYPETDKTKRDPYLSEKFDLYKKLFLKSTYEQRKDCSFMLMNYPLNSVVEFVLENFDGFSNEEKMTVILMCGDSELRTIPPEIRKRILDGVMPSCNQEQLGYVKFVREKGAKK